MTFNSLRLAVGTLTAVRVPPPALVSPTVAGRAMLLAPVVGLVPGGLAALVIEGGSRLSWSAPLCAALAVGSMALMTRGLHLDGLCDTADGLASSYDRARALEVMRRGDCGPAGAATLVLVLVVQVLALAQALSAFGPVAALVAAVAGRCALPLVCRRGVPSARPEGLGAVVVGSVRPGAAVLIITLVTVAAGLLPPAGWGAAAVLAAVVAGYTLARRATTRLGGVTGDVLGAAVEAATTAALLVLAVA
jgi:adenosylcobinamide-GDP ribazoletransferase